MSDNLFCINKEFKNINVLNFVVWAYGNREEAYAAKVNNEKIRKPRRKANKDNNCDENTINEDSRDSYKINELEFNFIESRV